MCSDVNEYNGLDLWLNSSWVIQTNPKTNYNWKVVYKYNSQLEGPSKKKNINPNQGVDDHLSL